MWWVWYFECEKGGVEMVEKVEIKNLEEEISVEKYAMNPRRYQNAIIENQSGLPESIVNLDEVSLRQVLNYVNEIDCEWTGKKTFGDKVVSYINSGVYKRTYLEGVFGVKEVVRQWRKRSSKSELAGSSEDEEQEIESRYYIKNKTEYAKIEIAAIQNWNNKGLNFVFQEYLQERFGQLDREVVENAVLVGIKESPDHATKLKYLKIASDILGMKGKTNLMQINLYKDGGGNKHNQTVIDVSGNDNYDLGIDVE